jgi:type I restriction enzyme, S subunit
VGAWPRVKLADCVNLLAGFAFKSQMFSDKDDDVALVKGENVSQGCILWDISKRWPAADWTRMERFQLHPGDVVVAMDRPWIPAGLKWAYIREDDPKALLVQRCARLRSSDGRLDQRFLRFVIGAPGFESYVRPITTGVNVPHISGQQILDYQFTLPPLSVQRRIAGILSAYDELIENSQRRSRILEAMARALYREWFVHFRFPGHENHTRVPSPLGEIPKGWEVKKLGDLISIDKGVSYNGAGLTEDGNPMVNLKNILAGGGFRRDATKPYSGDFKPRHTVKPGDIILANTDLTQAGNVVASTALIPRLADDRPILISHHLFAVRLPGGLPASFIYHLLLEDDFRGFAKGYAIGTTVLGLPKEGVLNFAFALPSGNLIADFVKQVAPIHQLIETLLERIENLRQTRDLLLPRLLSGQAELETV